jgi:hypothetical protein
MLKNVLLASVMGSCLFSNFSYAELPPSCNDLCATPFGTKLGQYGEVESFSNCQTSCNSGEMSQNPNHGDYVKQVEGQKWHSMRFIKDHLFFNLGLIIEDPSIQDPVQLFEVAKLRSIRPENDHPYYYLDFFAPTPNSILKEGDIVIFNSSEQGHAAIVAKVFIPKDINQGGICLVEENFTNSKWIEVELGGETVQCSRLLRPVAVKGAFSFESTLADADGWVRIRKDVVTPRTNSPNSARTQLPVENLPPLLERSFSSGDVLASPAAANINPSRSTTRVVPSSSGQISSEKKGKKPGLVRRLFNKIDDAIDSTLGSGAVISLPKLPKVPEYNILIMKRHNKPPKDLLGDE